jgi:putative transcriptional regulator
LSVEVLPDLWRTLADAKTGLGRITTAEQIIMRKAGEKSWLTQFAFAERIENLVASCAIGSKTGSHP